MNRKSASQIIGKRKLVAAPGKFRARIIGDANFFDGNREGMDKVPARFIVGTDLISADQKEVLQKNIALAIDAEKNQADVDWSEVLRGSNLSASFLFGLDGSAPKWVPTRGEIVEVFVDYVPGPGGDTENQVLRIISVNPVHAGVASAVDVKALFGEISEEVPATTHASALSEE